MTLEQAIRKLHPAILRDANGEAWDTDVLLSDSLDEVHAASGEFIVDGDVVVLMDGDGFRRAVVYTALEVR